MKVIIFLKIHFLEYLKWIFLIGFIAVIVGTSSALFLYTLDKFTSLRTLYPKLIYFLPMAGLCIGFVYHYYAGLANKGNSLLIKALNNPSQNIPFKITPLIYFSTLLTHLFGGSAGREGTALQMASGFVSPLSKLFRLNDKDFKILLRSAIAAGFGSVFGTPLAGAFFSLEFALIGKISYKGIFPVFISSILAHIFTVKFWGIVHTNYPTIFCNTLDMSILFYIVVAGILFAFVALAFSKSMLQVSKLFNEWIVFPPFRPLIGGIILAILILSFNLTEFSGLGIPTIEAAFINKLPAYDFLLKFLFTILTLGSGFKGGEVTPLFFVGATMGNALSYFIPLPLDVLVALGFVAVFSGATHTPIASVFLGIELFGADLGIGFAIVCLIGYFISRNTGIYQAQVLGQPKFDSDQQWEQKTLEEIYQERLLGKGK